MKVKIYKPSKNAMQSGTAKTNQWVMEPDQLIHRSPEPLMGWTQSNSTLHQVKLRFDKLEEAIAHAQEQGWEYSVQKEHSKNIKPRNYGDNFKYTPPASNKTSKPSKTRAAPSKAKTSNVKSKTPKATTPKKKAIKSSTTKKKAG